MASSAPPQPPPKITIYRNGDRHFPGKKFVVNRKYYRSFENFLDKVTADTRSRFAIRKIHTPSGGTRIGSLEKIQNGAVYVAAGLERFRRIEYGTDTLKMTTSSSTIIHPVTHSKIIATSRYKQEAMAEPLRNRIIFVYRNGEEKTAPVKLLLDKRTLRSMDTVLQYISNKVNLTSGAVKSIHSMESGTKVTDVSQISTNISYVAVGSGKHFNKSQVFNDSIGKILSPRDKATFGYSKKLKNKETKKVENEQKRVVTSSLSMPDVGLTSGIIALSKEIINKNLSQDLDDSNETSVDNDLDVKGEINTLSFENIANEIESVSKADDTPRHTKSPINNDTKTTDKPPGTPENIVEITPKILKDMSGTPPATVLHETEESIIEEITPEILKGMSGTPPATVLHEAENSSIETNNIEESQTIEISPNKTYEIDEPVNNIENPPFTNSPVLSKGDKHVDTDTNVVSNELPGSLQVNTSGNDNDDHDDTDTDEASSGDSSADESEESVQVPEEEQMSELTETQNEEEPSAVYKASGLQKESAEQIKDNKETTVEKTIDMLPAAEVEEDLETQNETSNFQFH